MKIFQRFYYGILMAVYGIAVAIAPLWHGFSVLLTGKSWEYHIDKMWDFIDNYSTENQLFKK